MNPIKTLVVVLFITASAFTANAQERYEHMTVMYKIDSRQLYISSDNGEYKQETVAKSESKGPYDVSPALVRIKQWSEQGWELYETSVIIRLEHVFHLRRPLK